MTNVKGGVGGSTGGGGTSLLDGDWYSGNPEDSLSNVGEIDLISGNQVSILGSEYSGLPDHSFSTAYQLANTPTLMDRLASTPSPLDMISSSPTIVEQLANTPLLPGLEIDLLQPAHFDIGIYPSQAHSKNTITKAKPEKNASFSDKNLQPQGGSNEHIFSAEEVQSLDSRTLENRNAAMIEALEPFVESNDYIGFWQTAEQFGEPLSPLARAFHGSLYGETIGTRYAVSKLELAKTGGNTRLPPEQLADLKKEVGAGLMKAHYIKLQIDIKNNDSENTPGLLSVKQIQDYHEYYFESIGLPPNTYGGSNVPDFIEEWVYCGNCDPKP